MLKPIEGQKLPQSNHSRDKIQFICECGNKKWIVWKNYKTNHTKSCGMCKRQTKYNINNIKHKQFGFLTLNKTQEYKNITSNSKLLFDCKCGNSKLITLKSVVNNLTTSCGKCNLSKKGHQHKKPILKSKEEWLNAQLPLKLINKNLPEKWSNGSGKLFWWECNCGNIFKSSFNKIYSKHKSTCGKCNYEKKENHIGKTYGKLTLIDKDLPKEFHKNTSQKFWFQCECGITSQHEYSSVIKGKITTCNKCNNKSSKWWSKQKFGHLTIIDNNLDDIKLYSEKLVKCKCSCGNECYSRICDLIRGHKKTCGKCLDKAKKWWSKHREIKPDVNRYGYSLKNLQLFFDGSYLLPLESSKTKTNKILFKCKLCGNNYMANLGTIIYSKVCSCGCVKSSISFNSIEIGMFIEKYNINCFYGKNESIINGFKIDVCVPNKLLIEHNGLKWHTDSKIVKRDLEKYILLSKQYDYMMIFEDEWNNKKDIFKSIILNRLQINTNIIKLRPQKCEILLINNKEVKKLYNKFHYQGHTNSKFNIGVKFNNKLIASMSINKPTRQNSGDWEISRMVCDNNYKIYGIWSYLLKWVIKNLNITGKLVSFSDNRLMTGKVYRVMGFTKIKDIKPDYYWVKNNKRHHKSSLRKTEEEKKTGKTETQLRIEQGYTKIFDLGKSKWELTII